MMSRVIVGELQAAVTAFLSGGLITIVYDVLRIFRRIISHNNFWIGAEDLVFWMWTALWTFSVLYRENDGNLRLYTMVFMAAGMLAYHEMISEPLMYFSGKIIKKLKKYAAGIIIKLTQNRKVCPWRKKNGNKNEPK